MTCQLCERLFSRFEFTLEQFPRLAEFYRVALAEHAMHEHGARVQEKIEKFFSLPINEYCQWLAAETPAAWVNETYSFTDAPYVEIADGMRAKVEAVK